MKIIKTYESYNSLDDLDLGDFSNVIKKFKLIPNDDGTYDYHGDLGLNDVGLNSLLELPVRFKNVYGGFSCSSNNLISLEGAPEYVKTIFKCSDNELISLQYLPSNFKNGMSGIWCWDNNLLSFKFDGNLKGLDKNDGDFVMYTKNNPLKITDGVISSVKRMTHEQQISELNFFAKYDKEAYSMLIEILDGLGVDVEYRKEVLDNIKEKPNLKALGFD